MREFCGTTKLGLTFPYRVIPQPGNPESERADGQVIESCAIITMTASPFVAEIHNVKHRMPFVLLRQGSRNLADRTPDAALACLHPYPEMHLGAHTVSTVVNSPKNNEPRLIEPLRDGRGAQ